MKRKDITQLHEMTVDQLEQKLVEVNQELSKAKMQRSVAKLSNHRLVRTLRKNVARIKTILTEKQLDKKA